MLTCPLLGGGAGGLPSIFATRARARRGDGTAPRPGAGRAGHGDPAGGVERAGAGRGVGLARGDTAIRHCHWLPSAGIGCDSLGMYTLILRSSLPLSVKMAVSRRATQPVERRTRCPSLPLKGSAAATPQVGGPDDRLLPAPDRRLDQRLPCEHCTGTRTNVLVLTHAPPTTSWSAAVKKCSYWPRPRRGGPLGVEPPRRTGSCCMGARGA